MWRLYHWLKKSLPSNYFPFTLCRSRLVQIKSWSMCTFHCLTPGGSSFLGKERSVRTKTAYRLYCHPLFLKPWGQETGPPKWALQKKHKIFKNHAPVLKKRWLPGDSQNMKIIGVMTIFLLEGFPEIFLDGFLVRADLFLTSAHTSHPLAWWQGLFIFPKCA